MLQGSTLLMLFCTFVIFTGCDRAPTTNPWAIQDGGPSANEHSVKALIAKYEITDTPEGWAYAPFRLGYVDSQASLNDFAEVCLSTSGGFQMYSTAEDIVIKVRSPARGSYSIDGNEMTVTYTLPTQADVALLKKYGFDCAFGDGDDPSLHASATIAGLYDTGARYTSGAFKFTSGAMCRAWPE